MAQWVRSAASTGCNQRERERDSGKSKRKTEAAPHGPPGPGSTSRHAMQVWPRLDCEKFRPGQKNFAQACLGTKRWPKNFSLLLFIHGTYRQPAHPSAIFTPPPATVSVRELNATQNPDREQTFHGVLSQLFFALAKNFGNLMLV